MAFLFSSSHLPASRVRRPDLEDEDNDENPEAMPRSGGVRASSHLEGRVAEPETARSAGGSPAPRSSGAGIDWMARLKELAEQQQQRRRADSAAPDSGPRRADDEHEPDAGADHDEDEIPGGVHDEAPEHGEHDDTSSWYHPPERGDYHPDPGFNVRPEDIGNVSSDPGFNIRSEDIGTASPGTGFYQHLPEIKGAGKPAVQAGRAPSSTQDWSGRQNDEGRDQPQGSQRSAGPDSPAGATSSSGPTSVFPNSRLFEMRPHPALAKMIGAGSESAQRLLSGQARAENRFRDDAKPVAGPRNGSPSSFAAQAAPSSKEERQPQGQAPSQPQQRGATKQAPASPPNTALAQAAPPPAKNPNENLPTFKVDPADESKMDFMLKDPVTQREYPTDRTFGDHVRSILQEELEKSPTARNLLERIIGKSGMPVIIQSTTKPEAYPEIKNGIFIIYINPTNVRLGTLTHEITHHLQKLALDKALASEEIKAIKDPNKRPAAVANKIRELLNGVLPVSPPGERTGKLGESQDYMENEAIRATNVAQAEISASRVKEKLDAMNKNERDSYLNDHTKLAALFWTEQGLHEDPGHDANDKTSFPIDTRYGDPAHFKHVLEILGITEQELMEACPYKDAWDKAAQERANKSQPSGRAGVR